MKSPQNFGDGVREESALLAGVRKSWSSGNRWRWLQVRDSGGEQERRKVVQTVQEPAAAWIHYCHYLHVSYTETKAHKG